MGIGSIFSIILASWVLCSSIGWAETLDRIVANVNGNIILYSELQDRIHVMERMSPELKTDDPSQKTQLEREVLRTMVRERLTEDEAKRLKITVSDRDVDSTIEGIKKENGVSDTQFEYMIQQDGLNYAQFRARIKEQMERSRLVDRVLKSKIVITEPQIDAYLKTRKSGELDERRRLAVIFIPISVDGTDKKVDEAEKRTREILGRLKGGADFAKLAKEYSKGPAAGDGGDIGFISLTELAPAIENAVRPLSVNEMTDLVQGKGGYYILKVLDIQKEKQNSSDSSVRERARKQLFQEEMNRRFEEWVRDLESKAFIQISL